MAQQSITIEKLAEMINEGFMATASKADIKAANGRLDGIDSRLDRIEYLLLEEQKRRSRTSKHGGRHAKTASPSCRRVCLPRSPKSPRRLA
jgi:hypothetical protein